MATVVIANPASRSGWVGKHAPELERRLRAVIGDVRFAYTKGPGDGARLAGEAIDQGVTTLASLGGDGTHSDVASGILSRSAGGAVSLGILHAGTGGDFRKLLVRSDSLEASASLLRDTPAAEIDAGEVHFTRDDGTREKRYFLNIASLGMGGLVDRHVARSSGRLGGKATYFVASLRAFFEYDPAVVELEIDGRNEGTFRISNLCVCNGQFAGGGMHFAPHARLADGQFDVIVLEHAPIGPSLAVAKGLYDGSHLRSPLVHEKRGAHIRVTPKTSARAFMDIDGEAPGVTPAEFRLLPRALRVHGLRQDVL